MVAASRCVWPQIQWYQLVYATEIKSIQLHDSIKRPYITLYTSFLCMARHCFFIRIIVIAPLVTTSKRRRCFLNAWCRFFFLSGLSKLFIFTIKSIQDSNREINSPVWDPRSLPNFNHFWNAKWYWFIMWTVEIISPHEKKHKKSKKIAIWCGMWASSMSFHINQTSALHLVFVIVTCNLRFLHFKQ